MWMEVADVFAGEQKNTTKNYVKLNIRDQNRINEAFGAEVALAYCS